MISTENRGANAPITSLKSGNLSNAKNAKEADETSELIHHFTGNYVCFQSVEEQIQKLLKKDERRVIYKLQP